MESHGGTHVDETGLEGPMWQLSLSGGPESFPERPGEPDCSYYLRTGSCGFGNRCRFNHPRDRSVASEALQASDGELPERIGQPLCQHYVRTGTCKFGPSCRFHHPRVGLSPPISYNFHGYPLRPGQQECTYYMKTGLCKYGAACKFHHPQPAGAEPPPPPPPPPPQEYPPQQYGNLIQISGPAIFSSSYIPTSYAPMTMIPQGVFAFPSWTPYPAYASGQPTISASASSSYAAHEYPQRPGEPECQHYMRTGGCKFGSNCKFHHPPEAKAGPVLGPTGLPLRPGAPICSHYSRKGACRFGPWCKFDHPMRTIGYSSSTSSLADIPVAPFPVGPTENADVAPSSSSSKLRLEDELRKADDDVV